MYFVRNRIEMLTMYDISALSFMYLKWPRDGLKGMLESIPPREYQEAILESEYASAELKALVKRWLESGVEETCPFEEIQETASFDLSLCGKVGYPNPGEFADRNFGTPVDVDAIRAAVKINVVGSLIVFLTENLPIRCGSLFIRDLYLALRDPRSEGDNLTFLGKWVYGCISKYVVIPEFGSVENFIKAIMRLKKEGDGFMGLVDNELNLQKVKTAVPDDPDLHKLADVLGKLDTTKDVLELRLVQFTFDNSTQWQYDSRKRWTFGDQEKAEEIMKELFHGQ